MNCKPGDLAVIVRGERNLGLLVEVLTPLGVEPSYGGFTWRLGRSAGQFHWLVRSLGKPMLSKVGNLYEICPMPDVCLRPIRDPGDDAVDETLVDRRITEDA